MFHPSPLETEALPAGRDVSLPFEALVPMIRRWVLPLLLIFPLLHLLIQGWDAFASSLFTWRTLLLFLPGVLLLTIAHELTHAVGWIVFGRVSPMKIRFGIIWHVLTPYAHSQTPMPARGYRIGALLPTLTTALLPGIFALMTNDVLLSILSSVMLMGALGDFAVVYVIRDVPADTYVIDHPRQAGCIVLDSTPASTGT